MNRQNRIPYKIFSLHRISGLTLLKKIICFTDSKFRRYAVERHSLIIIPQSTIHIPLFFNHFSQISYLTSHV